MKSNDSLKNYRAKSAAELSGELTAAKKELFNLRFQSATGQLANPQRISECKKDIARVKTILRERELAAKAE